MTTSSTQTTRSTEFHQQTLQPTPAKEEMSNHITSKGCKPRAKKYIYINTHHTHFQGLKLKQVTMTIQPKPQKPEHKSSLPFLFVFFFASLSINKKKVKKEKKKPKNSNKEVQWHCICHGRQRIRASTRTHR